jgi:hypothetical protein
VIDQRQKRTPVVGVDASWLSTVHLFRDLGAALGGLCHDQWHCLGESLDNALADTWDRSVGFVLALTGSDVFAGHHVDDAHILLETIAERAWPSALLGHRLICLVQSDDPRLKLQRIGMSILPWFDHDLAPRRGDE